MLSHAKLLKSFWREVMQTVIDIINLLPSIPLDDANPKEIWSKKMLSYNYLKVFGCRAFVHIPKDKGAKVD